MYVIKRNGTEVDFDKSKIINAITKANNEVSNSSKLSNETIINIANTIEMKCIQLDKTCTVEEIQDMVEDELFKNKAYKLCKCYMSYRYKKALERKSNTTDEQILSLIHLNNEEIKQENSNKNPTINSTQRDYIAGEISKDISKRLMLPKDVVEAHNEGILHFHDMDYFIQPMHNCFSGYTEFVTDKGIRKFNSFNDGDSVYIKDKDGVIRLATVRNYGKQLMHKVTLKNCVKEKTIICTPNHRWILDDGSITTNLQVGQYLYPLQNSTSYDINSYLEAEAFCLGFVLGDGTDTNNNATRVRLCGDKTKYSTIFKKAGYSIHTQKDTSDLFVYRTGSIKQNFLNGCGWRYMTPELKSLVFKGYYAADGTKDSNRLSTVDSRLELFIEEVSSLAGYYISSKKEIIRDTEYKQNARLVNYHFVTNQKINFKWKVVKIEKLYKYEDAWCVEEPITNTFTLACGIVTGNCCLVNLEDMLQNGTVISGTMIEKPHSFSTACNVATQIIAQVASSQYGGQTITLSHLAPFVDVSRQKIRKQLEDELNKLSFTRNNNIIDSLVEQRVKEEIKKGVQTIQYQVLTLMTTNGQTPFITVSMYLGEVENEQTKNDLALIIEEMLKQRMEGVKNEKGVYITPAFPKLVYVLEEDNINTDSKYWYLTELAAKCTAKRMVPDYVSEKIMKQLKINKFGTGDCYPPMGCRSFLTPYRTNDNLARAKNYDSTKPKYFGRFNQGVVTLNLVDVALSSNKDINQFWDILNDRLKLCYKALMCRHNKLLGTPSDVAPILWQNGALARLDKGEKIDKLLYDGYSTISLGYAGLYECVKYMTNESHTQDNGKKFGLEVMQKLNDACNEWKKNTNIDFSLYGTPLESTTYKFAKCLKNRFGIIDGITDKNYITNSYHIHVTENIDAFSKLTFESEFQKLSPGGAISYVEVPNMENNIPAVLALIKHIYNNILYAELNTKSDYCQCCGYTGEIKIEEDSNHKLIWKCPNCGNTDQNKMNVARRTCGYIGTQYWNQGRTQEIKDRVLHL